MGDLQDKIKRVLNDFFDADVEDQVFTVTEEDTRILAEAIFDVVMKDKGI